MNTEEKARAYDEALKRAKAAFDVAADKDLVGGVIRTIFPEFYESKDEKIRKVLVELVKWVKAQQIHTDHFNYGIKWDEMIAYLEKQKDKMTAEEHETVKVNINGIHGLFPPVGDGHYIDEHVALDKTAGEKQKEQSLRDFIEDFPYSAEQKEQNDIPLMNGDADLYFDNWIQHNDTTKRGCFEEGIRYAQRLQKEQKPAEYGDDIVEEAEEYTSKVDCGEYGVAVIEAYIAGILSERNRKPAEWSEEDKKKFDNLLYLMLENNSKESWEGCYEWLTSLPKRFNIQPKQEWSDEDEKTLNAIIDMVGNSLYEPLRPRAVMLSWLNSLRPQFNNKEIYQAAKHDLAIKFMNYLDENRPEGKMCLSNGECEDIDKAFKENDWAKIERYIHKYHWKPSEEQMNALNALNCHRGLSYVGQQNQLISLYNDLKKL